MLTLYIKSKTLFYEAWKMHSRLHNTIWIVVNGIILMPLDAAQRLQFKQRSLAAYDIMIRSQAP